MSRGFVAALAATGLAAALFWLASGTTARLPESPRAGPGWSGDFLHFYLPNAEYAGARLARGEIPLWNPHQGAGAPFLATLQAGVLYPPNWLHAALPAQTAFLLLAAFHTALAVASAGALAGALGAGPAGAAVAGLAYATSFNVAGSVWTPPVQYATAWAPAILLAVDRAIARPGPRAATGLALALALSLLTGWPYVVLMTALAASLYGAALLAGTALRRRRLPLRALAALAAGVAGGLALAAPQLLPARELVAQSVRALGTLVEGQAIWAAEPHDPAQWFRFFGERGFNDAVPGLAALALCLVAIALPGPGRLRLGALVGVGALGFLVSFPDHTPLFRWLRELPLFADFRFPFRYRLLPNLAVAIGAGVGTDHLLRLLAGRPWLARAAAAAALLATFATTSLPAARAIRPFVRETPERPGFAAELEALGIDPSADPYARSYWFGRSDKLGLAPDRYAVHDLEPLSLARTAELITFFESGRARTLATVARTAAGEKGKGSETLAPPFYGFLALPDGGERAAVLDLLSVRWLVSDRGLAWLEQRYRRVSPDGAEWFAYENPWALPRAYRVARALPEPDDVNEALRRLAAPRFPRRRIALLDAPPPALLAGRGAAAPRPSGGVEIVRYEPERVVLRTTGDEAAAVVLTDAWFPGWRARVDGAPAPVLRANVAFRAVAVPAGPHEIELRYRPASLRAGAALAVGAALVGAIALRRGRGRV